jgi:hypothetical protein
MFGKYQGVFRSRWKAVWWSLGILMTAYCTVPSPDESDTPAAAKHPAEQHHDNPWVLDKP